MPHDRHFYKIEAPAFTAVHDANGTLLYVVTGGYDGRSIEATEELQHTLQNTALTRWTAFFVVMPEAPLVDRGTIDAWVRILENADYPFAVHVTCIPAKTMHGYAQRTMTRLFAILNPQPSAKRICRSLFEALPWAARELRRADIQTPGRPLDTASLQRWLRDAVEAAGVPGLADIAGL